MERSRAGSEPPSEASDPFPASLSPDARAALRWYHAELVKARSVVKTQPDAAARRRQSKANTAPQRASFKRNFSKRYFQTEIPTRGCTRRLVSKQKLSAAAAQQRRPAPAGSKSGYNDEDDEVSEWSEDDLDEDSESETEARHPRHSQRPAPQSQRPAAATVADEPRAGSDACGGDDQDGLAAKTVPELKLELRTRGLTSASFRLVASSRWFFGKACEGKRVRTCLESLLESHRTSASGLERNAHRDLVS